MLGMVDVTISHIAKAKLKRKIRNKDKEARVKDVLKYFNFFFLNLIQLLSIAYYSHHKILHIIY